MRFASLVVMLGLAVAILFIASLVIGPAGLTLEESLSALFGGENAAAVLVMQEIRLPRALLGLMIGATLGMSGAALQGHLRNPLADPGVIGIAPAATFGAVIAIYTGLAAQLPWMLPMMAMCGALAAVLVLRALAGGGAESLTLILAGIAISSLAGAMTSLALNLSPNPFAALEIVFWMLGSLSDRSFVHVMLSAPFMLAGWLMLAMAGRALDAQTLGTDVAATMGIDPRMAQIMIVGGTAISVGAATAVAGTIGFVGLVMPHILRPLVQHSPSRLLLASALGGAVLVLAADVATRLIAPERDLKLGVLTALVGAPFFLWLVLKVRKVGG